MFIPHLNKTTYFHEQHIAVRIGAGVNDETLLSDVATPARLQVDRHAVELVQTVQELIDLAAALEPDVRLAQQTANLSFRVYSVYFLYWSLVFITFIIKTLSSIFYIRKQFNSKQIKICCDIILISGV